MDVVTADEDKPPIRLYLLLVNSLLLILAILPWPYFYYQILRVVTAFIFAFFAIQLYQEKNKRELWFFIGTSLLFNPFFPIYLTKTIWIPINLTIGIYAGYFSFISLNKRKSRD